MAEPTLHEKYNLRRSELFTERESWVPHWRDISENLLPRAGRFLAEDGKENDGGKRHNNIYDSTGTKALRVLSAGLMAGMTSPARPWFRLAVSDADLMEHEPVKLWLQKVTMLMREVFARSNTYRALHSGYEELGAFGTAASFVMDDYDNVIHHHPLTIGEYAIAANEKGVIDTLYREFTMRVSQIVSEFVRQPDGSLKWDRVSSTVKNMWDSNRLDKRVKVTHVVEPRNMQANTSRRDRARPWVSCYYESSGNEEKFLREGGFRSFRVLVPRWSVSGGDIYGNSPGMEALGDIRQLQHQQFRKAQGIDYQTRPPVQAPSSLTERDVSMLPGGVTFHDMAGPQSKISPLWEVRLDLQHLLFDIQDVRERIRSTFYADLFMMIANNQRSNVTAREIAERHEEKLLMLGPVLERLHNELLKPKIDMTFDRIVEAGILPPPPEELQDMDLSVEFVSVLAQAQRAVGVQAVDRLVGTIASIAGAKQDPSIWDKLDTDQVVDAYSDMLGVDPNLIVADAKVAILRAKREQQNAAIQQAAMAQQQAQTAKDLSAADTGGENLLTDLTNQFSGYSIPA